MIIVLHQLVIGCWLPVQRNTNPGRSDFFGQETSLERTGYWGLAELVSAGGMCPQEWIWVERHGVHCTTHYSFTQNTFIV